MAKKGFEITRIGQEFAVVAGEVKSCNENDNGNLVIKIDIAAWNKESQAEETKELRFTFHDGEEEWQKAATHARKAKVGVGSFLIMYVKYSNETHTAGYVNRFVYPGRNLKVKYQKDDENKELNIVSGFVNYVGERETQDGRKVVYGLMTDKAHEEYDSMTVFFADKIAENAKKIFTRKEGQEGIRGIFVCGAEKERTWMDAEANSHTACSYTAYRFYTIREV